MPPLPADTPQRIQLQRMLRMHGLVGGGEQSSIGNYSTDAGINSATQSVDGGVQIQSVNGSASGPQDEVAFLNACKDAGVVYILGNNVVKARKDSSFFKKLVINYIYTFLRRLSRDSRVVLNIPHECLLQVGMVYYV